MKITNNVFGTICIKVLIVGLSFLLFPNGPGAAAATAGQAASPSDPIVVRLSDGFFRMFVPESYQTNIGVLAGPDGLLLIDTGHAPKAIPQLRTALKTISTLPVKFIIHTHKHGDHRAGDELGSADTVLIDRNRLDGLASRGILKGPAAPGESGAAAFGPSYLFRFNGEDILLFPAGGIHSADDILIDIPGKSILQTGDLFLSQCFPASEKVRDYMAFLDRVIASFPDGTRFVPGHGREVDKTGFKAYRDMLARANEIVGTAKGRGMSLDDMLKDRILKEFDSWHTLLDWLGTDFWTRAVFASY